MRSTRTVHPGRDAAPAALPDGKQRSAGIEGRLALGTPFAATKLVLDSLWNERGSLVEQTDRAVRSLPGGSHESSTAGTVHKGSLTQRGPPLQIPLSGFGQMMGSAAATGSGSSGDGTSPLFAVIVPCLIALLCGRRFLTFCAFFRPGTVTRLALERPG